METVKQPAWLYHASYVFENRRGSVPGTAHGAEIPLLFDNPPGLGTDSDRKMAQRVSAYWVRFAKTGNPNPPGADEWPTYDRKTDRLLEFGIDHMTVRANFRRRQLDLIENQWRSRDVDRH
jgi:para-nitrobenzyl esterase